MTERDNRIEVQEKVQQRQWEVQGKLLEAADVAIKDTLEIEDVATRVAILCQLKALVL